MTRFLKKNLLSISAVLIFIVFMLLRFYSIDKRINFDWDQESYLKAIKNMILLRRPGLIGPRVVSETGFFLGPYFYYILFPFVVLSKLHPMGLAYFVILVSIIFFTFGFFVIKQIFSLKTAVLFMFLWATNYLLIGYDKNPWNPIFIPLGTITVIYLLRQITKSNQSRDWFLLGISLGLFFNMHFQFVFLVVFSSFLLLLQFKFDIYKEWRKIFIMISSFIFVFIPLFVFDLKHDFLNLKLFFNFFTSNQGMRVDHFTWFKVFGNFIKPITVASDNMTALIVYLVLTFSSLAISLHRKNFHKIFYFSVFLLFVFVFLVFSFIYRQRPSEYYFLFLYPFIYLLLLELFISLKKQYLLIFITLITIWLNKVSLEDSLAYASFTLNKKEKAVQEIKKRVDPERKFNISLDTPLGENSGYKYLIEYYNIKQSGDWTDPLIQIHIPPQKGNIRIGDKIGIEIPPELRK